MKDYFKFKLSISTENFTHKPESSRIAAIKYNVVELDCKEIIYLLKKGYAFTHVFTDNTTFTQKEKTINNFKYTHFVAVDVDNSVVDMNQYISSIEFTPTFAYTTFSNCKEGKGYRFRLVYVVNNKITSKERYTDVYRHFTDKLNLEDNCMQSVAQQCFGTTQDADTFISNKVYDLDSIESYKVDVNSTNGHSNFIKKEEENIIQLESPFYNKDFLNDYYSLSYKDFLEKYKDVYPFFYSTKLPVVDDDTPYILLPQNYLEIKRYWLVEKDINDEGNEIHKRSKVRKLKNGQNRRKKLFINAILRRFMLPELTPEYLLCMLVYELYFYIDNTDDKITKKDLFEICNNALKAKLDNYKQLSVQKHSNFIVNDNYCIKYNVNRKQARNIAKKMLNYEKIGNLYDCSITDKENLKIMKDAGLDISEKTLRRFKKDNGLTRTYNKKCNSNKNGHSNFIKKEEGNIIQLESPIVDVERNEKTKLIHKLETLYNKYSNIKDETEAKEKYLLFTQYLQKHCTLLTNTEYNNYLKQIQEKKDYIVAMYTQDFSVFANYCTTHNVVNFS